MYDYWITPKNLVSDEIITILLKSTLISINLGPRILNSYFMEYHFPLAVQRCFKMASFDLTLDRANSLYYYMDLVP